jgi:hypothetical protein
MWPRRAVVTPVKVEGVEHNRHSESSHFRRSGSLRHPAAGRHPAEASTGGRHGQRDLRIAIGGIKADVTKPCPDNIDFNARFQQVDSRAVSKGVRE